MEREVLISELRTAAEPLRESCAAEVSERVDAVVNEAVQAWEDTRSELGDLCTRYQHAVRLWQQYRDSSAAVKAWVDTQMSSVANLPPEEALTQVKVSHFYFYFLFFIGYVILYSCVLVTDFWFFNIWVQ